MGKKSRRKSHQLSLIRKTRGDPRGSCTPLGRQCHGEMRMARGSRRCVRPRCGGGRMPRAHARSLTVFTLSFLAVCLVLARSRLLWSAALFHHQTPAPELLLARAGACRASLPDTQEIPLRVVRRSISSLSMQPMKTRTPGQSQCSRCAAALGPGPDFRQIPRSSTQTRPSMSSNLSRSPCF